MENGVPLACPLCQTNTFRCWLVQEEGFIYVCCSSCNQKVGQIALKKEQETIPPEIGLSQQSENDQDSER